METVLLASVQYTITRNIHSEIYLQLGTMNSYYTNRRRTTNDINIDTNKLCKNVSLFISDCWHSFLCKISLNLVETRMNQIYYSVVSCTKNAN